MFFLLYLSSKPQSQLFQNMYSFKIPEGSCTQKVHSLLVDESATKRLKLQFILLSAQQAVQRHYFWSGTDPNVIINSEIKNPEKKSVLSKNDLGQKRTTGLDYNRA